MAHFQIVACLAMGRLSVFSPGSEQGMGEGEEGDGRNHGCFNIAKSKCSAKSVLNENAVVWLGRIWIEARDDKNADQGEKFPFERNQADRDRLDHLDVGLW